MAAATPFPVAHSAAWIHGAVSETTQSRTPWSIYEDELLEHLAGLLTKAHPKLCKRAEGEPDLMTLLEPLREAAAMQLEKQAKKAERQRIDFEFVARLALNVHRAVAKFKLVGARNLKAQLRQGRMAREFERANAKKEAVEAKARRESAATAKAAKKAEKEEVKKQKKKEEEESEESSEESEEDSESESEEEESDEEESDEESDDTEKKKKKKGESSSDEESDDESSDDDDSSSKKSSSVSSTAGSTATSSAVSASRKPLKNLKHIELAPGALHAKEQRERILQRLNTKAGYKKCLDAEKAAFPPDWYDQAYATLAKGLAEGKVAREKQREAMAAAAKQSGGDMRDADKNALQQVEGKIQAIGGGYADRFSHFQRRPALLEPPGVAPSVRQQILGKAANELLNELGFGEDSVAQQEVEPSQVRRLVEAHVKYVTQRALWREGWRRAEAAAAAEREHKATTGSGDPDGSAPAGEEELDIRTVTGLMGEGLSRLETISMLPLLTKLERGLTTLAFTDSERSQVELRASALLLQARECGADDVAMVEKAAPSVGSLILPIALANAPSEPHRRRTVGSVVSGRGKDDGKKGNPLEQPLEPVPIAMLLYAQTKGIAEAVRSVVAEDGMHYILKERWPRLTAHLHTICSRADLSDATMRQQGRQPPVATLERIVMDEWLAHVFVGALPRDSLLWVWDQFVLQGWHLAAEICACCFWLIRREVRRLDAAFAGATELRGAMTLQLLKDGTLNQLQALLAATSAKTIDKVGQAPPQVMMRLPTVGYEYVPNEDGD